MSEYLGSAADGLYSFELVIAKALQVSTAMFRQAARIDKHLAQTSLPAGAGISAILNVP